MRKGNWCGTHKSLLHARIEQLLDARLGAGAAKQEVAK
jgi:hypothetical protein